MNTLWLQPLLDATLKTALIVGFGGSLLAIALGLLLLLAPATYLGLAARLNTWISLRRGMKAVEIPRYQERSLYRHHRLFGLLVIIGALYTLRYFLLDFDRAIALKALRGQFDLSAQVLDWLLDAGSLVLVVCNLLVLVIGGIVLVRPSLLKHVEAWGNRWVSTRHATRILDSEYHGLDRLTARHPRGMGLLLVIGGMYVLGMLTIYLI